VNPIKEAHLALLCLFTADWTKLDGSVISHLGRVNAIGIPFYRAIRFPTYPFYQCNFIVRTLCCILSHGMAMFVLHLFLISLTLAKLLLQDGCGFSWAQERLQEAPIHRKQSWTKQRVEGGQNRLHIKGIGIKKDHRRMVLPTIALTKLWFWYFILKSPSIVVKMWIGLVL
jgi:hypothetical protein